jgi:hypothetical protein
MVVTDQDAVHQIGNPVRLTWVAPEKRRCQLGDSGPDALGMSGDVGRSDGVLSPQPSAPSSQATRTIEASNDSYVRPPESL